MAFATKNAVIPKSILFQISYYKINIYFYLLILKIYYILLIDLTISLIFI